MMRSPRAPSAKDKKRRPITQTPDYAECQRKYVRSRTDREISFGEITQAITKSAYSALLSLRNCSDMTPMQKTTGQRITAGRNQRSLHGYASARHPALFEDSPPGNFGKPRLQEKALGFRGLFCAGSRTIPPQSQDRGACPLPDLTMNAIPSTANVRNTCIRRDSTSPRPSTANDRRQIPGPLPIAPWKYQARIHSRPRHTLMH